MPILPNYPVSSPVVRTLLPDGTCDDITKCRTLGNIVLTCFTVVSLCIWTTQHPNVPPPQPRSTSSSLLWCWRKIPWEKVRMMFIALIAPEAIFALAVRQRSAARWFNKESNHKCRSMMHGFFIVMGGFITKDGNHPIATRELADKYTSKINAILIGQQILRTASSSFHIRHCRRRLEAQHQI
ncbi:hypothetical protein B0H12DRAFT_230339 [Mycena haematopus]|nr:hypothetical protein B0H12DRAFT_230339 [Mycena haematopus]